MKPISNNILSFLNKEFGENKFNGIMFSTKTYNMLKEIFILMIQGEEYYNRNKDKINTIKSLQLPNSDNFHYIPTNIRKVIENIDGKCIKYTFYINNKEYIVSFYYDKTEKFNTDNFIKNIFIWLFITNVYSNKKCSQKMVINLYLTNLKKTLPENNNSISQDNANTAFTTSCKEETEINLFRYEEWFKVLIHETFHCTGMDFSQMNYEDSNNKILSIFPLKTDVRLFETYCEMWGEIINVMFISYFTTKENENLEKYIDILIKKTKKMLYYERLFSLFQCAKILNYFGIEYHELYEKSEKAKLIRKYKYKDDTHVLSYYILKSICIYYIDDFIEWCSENNQGSLNFIKNYENINDFIDFIKERYDNKEYRYALNIFEKWFDNNNNIDIYEIYTTLRMSLFET